MNYSATFSNLINNKQTFDIISSQGFSLESLIRGLIGILILILISFLFSKNRKKINWKTVLVGLGFQIVLAVLVLKIPFVKSIFETAGKAFVKILDFTMQGTSFLFGDLVSDENFGNVFIFSILPTVIFFAALTSILFYFGVIQKIVKL